MSSSPTETLVDVTMPQMGVSVAEGTVVEWKKQPGDWVERDEIIASISTDKIDTDVEAPASGRVQEILVEVGTTVDVGVVMARIATDAKPGEAHASERPGHVRGRGRAEGARRRGRPVRRHDIAAARSAARRRPRSRALLAGGHADRRRARHRPRAGAGDGPRRAACASPTCSPTSRATARRRKSRRCTSRARTSPSRSRREEGGGAGPDRPGRAALAHAPVDRQGDDRVAADRGDVHDDHRGRPDPDREGPRDDRADVAALHRPRDDRDAARVPVAQRDARGRDVHAVRGGQPRHRGLARHGRPDRPGHPRRAGPQRRGAGQGDQGARPQGARQPAHARRRPRRHVHDHQPRRLRLDHGDAGDQPAAGGDPRHRGGRQAAGGDHRRARRTTRSRSAT